MSYQGYVIAAYAVFAVVLLWDFVAPRIQMRQLVRAARLRTARGKAILDKDTGFPLSRE